MTVAQQADHNTWPGHWATPPRSWDDLPESRLIARETHNQLAAAIEALPPSQRAVITLRDIEGWAADEVCQLLGITETHQRVLLHRARDLGLMLLGVAQIEPRHPHSAESG